MISLQKDEHMSRISPVNTFGMNTDEQQVASSAAYKVIAWSSTKRFLRSASWSTFTRYKALAISIVKITQMPMGN